LVFDGYVCRIKLTIKLRIMIKVMKLQKALIAIILGVIALIAYMILSARDIEWSKYVLEASGLFLMLGALLFLYPILFARKDKEGCVELDPDVPIAETPETVEK
jgi:hypothetical protein